MDSLCDRCAKAGTKENPLKRAQFSGRLRHRYGCSAVYGPERNRAVLARLKKAADEGKGVN